MENVIRSIVAEELKKVNSVPAPPVAVPSLPVPAAPKQIKSNTEGRMSQLLSKIRNKSVSSSGASGSRNVDQKVKSGKTKKVQLKWSRYDPFKEKYEIVKSKDGGGYRFLKLEEGLPITFGVLKDQALAIYFDDDDKNPFFEHISDCYKVLCGPKGEEISEDINIWDYLDSKGLFLSKCFFILSTQRVNYEEDNTTSAISVFDNSNPQDFNDNVGNTVFQEQSLSSPTHKTQQQHPEQLHKNSQHTASQYQVEESHKRLICSVCSCTYESGSECMICEQNLAFNASCINDLLNENEACAAFSLDDEPNDVGDLAPSQSELRELRLRNFQVIITDS